MRLREVYAGNVKPGDVIGASVKPDAPTRPFQELASALTVESVDFDHNERGIRTGVRITWRGGFSAAPMGVADKLVAVES